MNATKQAGTILLITAVFSASAQRPSHQVQTPKKNQANTSIAKQADAPLLSPVATHDSVLLITAIEPATDSLDIPLVKVEPAGGKITQDVSIASIGASILTFENGVKVILKPTKFEQGKIIFQAFSPGGSSLYDDNNFQSASYATNIIRQSGLANLNALQLTHFLKGSEVELNTFIEERSEGLTGHAPTGELEKALQLIYLSFTAPRKDSAVFRQVLDQSRSTLAEAERDPGQLFNDTLAALMANYSVRKTGLTSAKIDQVRFERIYKIYNDRFGDASDFVFVFVGNFDPATIRPLLETYLGSLPGTGRQETARDLGIHVPSGKIRKEWRYGNSDKAAIKMIISGEFDYSRRNGVELQAVAQVLQNRLREKLRDVETGHNAPTVSVEYNKYPIARYAFTISFNTPPAKAEKVIAAADLEIRRLKVLGPSIDDLDRFVNGQVDSVETAIGQNAFWLQYLAAQYQDQEELTDIIRSYQLLDKLDRESVRQAANVYLGDTNVMTLLWLPDNTMLTASNKDTGPAAR